LTQASCATAANNETLPQLDQTICEFMPIQARRMMLGIESKAGKIPGT
jgi:hypothetical protein